MSVIIDDLYCKGCELCLVVCKPQALSTGTRRNAKGYLMPDVDQDACIACGNCEITCPEMAVTVTVEEK